MKMKALNEIESIVAASKDIPDNIKKEVQEKIIEFKGPLDTDRLIYRIVVASLGLAVLSALSFTFIIFLKYYSKDSPIILPEIFLAMGSAAVGALAGLLAPSPRGG